MQLVLGEAWMMSHNESLPRRDFAVERLRGISGLLASEPEKRTEWNSMT